MGSCGDIYNPALFSSIRDAFRAAESVEPRLKPRKERLAETIKTLEVMRLRSFGAGSMEFNHFRDVKFGDDKDADISLKLIDVSADVLKYAKDVLEYAEGKNQGYLDLPEIRKKHRDVRDMYEVLLSYKDYRREFYSIYGKKN